MNRGTRAGLLGLAILLFTTSIAAAETSSGSLVERRPYRENRSHEGFEGRTFLRVHTGLSIPSGDFDNVANTGWGIGGSIGYGIGRNTILSGGLAFHHFADEFVDGHTNIVPVTASVDYAFQTRGRVRPWVSGGLGIYDVSFRDFLPGGTVSDSETDFGFNFGFGVAGPLNPTTSWGAGFRFHHVVGNDFIDSNFVALQGGLSFPL